MNITTNTTIRNPDAFAQLTSPTTPNRSYSTQGKENNNPNQANERVTYLKHTPAKVEKSRFDPTQPPRVLEPPKVVSLSPRVSYPQTASIALPHELMRTPLRSIQQPSMILSPELTRPEFISVSQE